MDFEKKEKIIEYVRVICCLGVVMIHVFKSAHDCCEGLTPGVLFLCSVVVNNLRWCVPVFLMITGSLLLAPEKKLSFRKIGRYIWRIVVVLTVFGTGFALIEQVFNERIFNVTMFFTALVNMITGNTWDHMWYLYTLIVLYCFLPLLKACAGMKSDFLKYTIVIVFFFASVLSTLKGFGVTLGISVGTVSIYMLYMLAGYAIKREIIKIPKWLAASGVAMSAIYLAIMAYCSDIVQITVNNALISHSSVAVVIQSVCAFQLLLGLPRIKIACFEQQILSIANASFGIYILHMFYINLLYKVFQPDLNGIRAVLFLPIYILVLICTYGTAVLLRKIPVVNRFL